jgi:O-antigen ligase
VVTFTRGGWFGLAAGATLVLWLQFRGRLVGRRQLLTAVVAILLLALLLVPFAGLIRARLFQSEQDTLAVRENLNRTAMEVIVDHPITGIGLDNFVRVAPEYGTGWRWLMEGKSHKVHNVYLALTSEAGAIGLLLFIGFTGVVMLQAWRRGQQVAAQADWHTVPLARGLLAGIVSVLVHGMAAWGLLSYGVFPLFWMLVGLAAHGLHERGEQWAR